MMSKMKKVKFKDLKVLDTFHDHIGNQYIKTQEVTCNYKIEEREAVNSLFFKSNSSVNDFMLGELHYFSDNSPVFIEEN